MIKVDMHTGEITLEGKVEDVITEAIVLVYELSRQANITPEKLTESILKAIKEADKHGKI